MNIGITVFLQHDAVHSAAYAVVRSLSVRLSDTLCIVLKRVKISSNFFRHLQLCHSIFFPYQTLWQHSDGDPLISASNGGGVCKK